MSTTSIMTAPKTTPMSTLATRQDWDSNDPDASSMFSSLSSEISAESAASASVASAESARVASEEASKASVGAEESARAIEEGSEKEGSVTTADEPQKTSDAPPVEDTSQPKPIKHCFPAPGAGVSNCFNGS